MGKYSTGAKAGLIASLPEAAILASWMYYAFTIMLPIMEEEIRKQLIKQGLPGEFMEQMISMMVYSAVIGSFIFTIIVGVIAGALLVLLLERIKDKYTWPIQGVVAGLVLFIVLNGYSMIVNMIYGSPYPHIDQGLSIIGNVVGLTSYLIYGLIYAYFLNKWLWKTVK